MQLNPRIRCTCKETIKETDIIVIDFMNRLTHKACYQGKVNLIIGVGTYIDIAQIFPYFYEEIES